MSDSKQTTLGNESDKGQPQKESTLKSNLKFACILIVFLAIIVYLMYSFKFIQDRYDQLAHNVEQATKENKESITLALQAEYNFKSNSDYAVEAVKLAEKALAENQFELAKIYSLNAINHMPYEIKYIEAYFQLLEKQSPTQEELKRFADILDMSVFQIAPSEIQRLVAIKSTILQKLEDMNLVEQDKNNQEYQKALALKIDSLTKGKLSLPNIISGDTNVNIDMLSARIETIKTILEEGVLDEMETTKWNSKLSQANILFQLAVTLSSVENATSKAYATTAKTSPSEMELVTAQNQLQTANALLAQIWTIDCNTAPELLKKAQRYQTKITEIDAKIREIGSQPALDEIHKLVDEIESMYKQSNNLYTNRINEITQKIDKIKEKLVKVSDEKALEDVLAKLKKAGEYLQKLSKNRYNAYQKWALECLKECHKQYKSSTFWGVKYVPDEKGNSLFNNYLLDINPALLSYDMQSLYNSIYQKIYDEVEDKAASQIRKASHVCKSLEDF